MKKVFLLLLTGLLMLIAVFGNDRGAVSSINSRIRRIAEQGNIVRPEEIIPDLYAGSIDYKYPEPDQNIGVYLHNSADAMKSGQEGVLQIGLKSKSQSFDGIPAFNMVILVDTSVSMTAQIPQFKESMALLVKKVRPIDSLSLVGFNDTASVLFPADFMDAPEKKQLFIEAAGDIHPQGGTNIEEGLNAALEQALVNLKHDVVNIVILISDGTDLSARLNEEGARSGDIRVSLSWKNRNDLDIHVITPGGEHIYYGSKKDSTGGELDVDMNVSGETTDPIENIFWQEARAPVGTYRAFVQNFNFHGERQDPTLFKVELKNGKSIQHFEGQTSGAGNMSSVEVCSFEYSGDDQAQTFQIVALYKEKNVSISTLGIGNDFNAELMRVLAEEAYGASRFLPNSEVMLDIFGSDMEFERLAIPAARNLTMELEFLAGIEVFESTGAAIAENRLSYEASVLNMGDYRTFLTRYRLPAFAEDSPRTVKLAALTVKADGETVQEKTLDITLAETSREDPLVLYSSGMLRFAENLKKIGEIYHQDKDPSAALQKTQESAAEIDAVKRKLNNPSAFVDESFILARYVSILNGKIDDSLSPKKSIMSTDRGTTSRRFN